jgi:phenylacetate-CoA ligase
VQSARALQHAIKTFIGVSADIRVEPTSAIERSVGKARRVIDKRPKPGAVS